MIRTVLDSNVLVSGMMRFEVMSSTTGAIVRLWRQRLLSIVVSAHIVDEVEKALSKPYFMNQISSADARDSIQFLRRHAEWTEITTNVRGVATHASDDLVIATALSANVPVLVTGDAGLLRIEKYQSVEIIRPSRFIEMLGSLG